MQFGGTRLVVNGIALQVSLRFVLRHMIEPGDRVRRNAFHTPGLSGRQERLTRDIFGSAHVVQPESHAQDGNNFSVFGSEKMGNQFVLLCLLHGSISAVLLNFSHFHTVPFSLQNRAALRELDGFIDRFASYNNVSTDRFLDFSERTVCYDRFRISCAYDFRIVQRQTVSQDKLVLRGRCRRSSPWFASSRSVVVPATPPSYRPHV